MSAWHRYLKAVLLSPYIGSLLLCVVGLSAGALLLMHSSRTPREMPAPAVVATSQKPAHLALQSAAVPARVVPAKLTQSAATSAQPQAKSTPGIFISALNAEQLQTVLAEQGHSAHQAMLQPAMWPVLQQVSPAALFHIGNDMPLPEALRLILGRSAMPVKILEGRYALITKVTETAADLPGQGRGKGFLWVDLQTGEALGGIYFEPTNGEPTPTLTIFSNQIHAEQIRSSNLPAAFWRGVQLWQQLALAPPLTTRYFIGLSGRKTVLTHDEPLCNGEISTDAAVDACAKLVADAADTDQRAEMYLRQVRYQSNATARDAIAMNHSGQ